MPPKERLNKVDIEDGALEILRESGYDALNARALANRLGCSTMPLFRHFQNMEEIRRSAIIAATEVYSQYIRRGLSESVPFKGVGKEYIRFAKEEPWLFKLLFMTSHEQIPLLPADDPNRSDVEEIASISSGLPVGIANEIYREMWIFVHGIATLIVTNVMQFDEEEISKMLSDVFAGIKSQFKKHKKEIEHECRSNKGQYD